MGTWIPIAPTLDQNGCFTALAHLPNAGELKAKALDPDQAAFNSFWQRGSDESLSVSAAARVGLGALGSASAKYETRTFIWDVALYSDKIDGKPSGGLIYGTRWGAGIRIRASVSSFDADLEMNVGAVAAAASLGRADASFSVEGLGLYDPGFLRALPDPGRLDSTAFAQINETITSVVRGYLAPRRGLKSVPFMINVSNAAFFATPFERARSFVFAARQLAARQSLDVALSRTDDSLDPIAIRSAYQKWLNGADINGVPSDEVRDSARTWLKRCGIKA